MDAIPENPSHPVYCDPSVADLDVDNAKVIAYGDWSAYCDRMTQSELPPED